MGAALLWKWCWPVFEYDYLLLLLIFRAPFASVARDGDVYIASSTHPFEVFGVKLLAWLNGGKSFLSFMIFGQNH